MAEIILDIGWGFGAVLLLLAAWAIVTGRHDRYYKQFRHHGEPPDVDRRLKRHKR
jgi:hypothetical protein